MNKNRRSEGILKNLKTIVSWKNAVNMIGKQRKDTSLKDWAVVLLAETVQCALLEIMRGSMLAKVLRQ